MKKMVYRALTAFSPKLTVRVIAATLSLLICVGVRQVADSVNGIPTDNGDPDISENIGKTDVSERDNGSDAENNEATDAVTPIFNELAAEDVEGIVSADAAMTCNITKDAVICRKNAHKKLPANAVLTLAAALTVMRSVNEGTTSPSERAVCPASAAKLPSYQATSHIISVGQSLSVSELMRCMLCAEPQVFAYVLAIHIYGSEQGLLEKMNAGISELGAKNTVLTSLSDLSLQSTTVYDCAVILREFLNIPELLSMLSSSDAIVIASNGSAWNAVTLCNRFYSECCTQSQARADGILAGYFFTVGSAEYVYMVFENGSERYITIVADALTGYADALVLRSRV